MLVTAYGLACLVVVLLSLAERRSLPYAVILFSGWAAGFLPVQTWWFISLAEFAAMTAFLRISSPWRHWTIVLCVLPMLLLDFYYWLMKWLGVYVGVEYANLLTAILTIQLILCGIVGGLRVGRFVSLWLSRLLSSWLRLVPGRAGPQGHKPA